VPALRRHRENGTNTMNDAALALYNDMNPQMQRFIDAYFELGGTRAAATEAVKIAYSYTGNQASVQANKLLKIERVQKVMAAMSATSFAPLAVLAFDQLKDILETGMWHGQKVKPADGLKVMKEVFERGIGKVADKTEVDIVDVRSVEQIKSALFEKLQLLNPEEKQALAMRLTPEAPIDAEFVAIKAIDPAAPWGRKPDGTPKQKPGIQPKRVLPGPEAYRPPVVSDFDRVKKKRLKDAAAALRLKYAIENGVPITKADAEAAAANE
jgi:hypothetical protein